jgi:pyruvate kinase
VSNNEAFLRRTKIVATLGPATDDPTVLVDMVRAGLDVARINFSHGGKDEQRRR